MDVEYTNISSYPSLQNFNEQMNREVKKHQEDSRFHSMEKRRLKKELEALRVSAAYMHMTAILSHLLICCMSQDHMNENCQPVQLFWDKF